MKEIISDLTIHMTWDSLDDGSFYHTSHYLTQEDLEFVMECYRKAYFGIAIKQHEAESLVQLLTGKPIVKRKRCWACHCEGKVGHHEGFTINQVYCDKCGGTGYQGGEV